GVFGYFNMKGTGLSGRMQFIFCTIMVVSIVVITFMVGAKPGTGLENLQPLFASETTAFAAIISIVSIAPWAFVDFDNVRQAAEEFIYSSNESCMLLSLSIICAAVLYSRLFISTGMIQPWQGIVAENHVWGSGAAIQERLGTFG